MAWLYLLFFYHRNKSHTLNVFIILLKYKTWWVEHPVLRHSLEGSTCVVIKGRISQNEVYSRFLLLITPVGSIHCLNRSMESTGMVRRLLLIVLVITMSSSQPPPEMSAEEEHKSDMNSDKELVNSNHWKFCMYEWYEEMLINVSGITTVNL